MQSSIVENLVPINLTIYASYNKFSSLISLYLISFFCLGGKSLFISNFPKLNNIHLLLFISKGSKGSNIIGLNKLIFNSILKC